MAKSTKKTKSTPTIEEKNDVTTTSQPTGGDQEDRSVDTSSDAPAANQPAEDAKPADVSPDDSEQTSVDADAAGSEVDGNPSDQPSAGEDAPAQTSVEGSQENDHDFDDQTFELSGAESGNDAAGAPPADNGNDGHDAGDEKPAPKQIDQTMTPEQSENIGKLRAYLQDIGVDLQYERAEDKQGNLHWNLTASVEKADRTLHHTVRIEENCTANEVEEAFKEIASVFVKAV